MNADTFSQIARHSNTQDLPYLDAVIDEILRCGGTNLVNVRVATVNTEVLGHQIPAGTDVFMLTQGPSYTGPALPVEEAKRSKTSQQMADHA